MDKLIEEFKTLAESDISKFSKKEQQTYLQNARNDIDNLMDNDNIDLETFEKLLEIKKSLLAKLHLLEEE